MTIQLSPSVEALIQEQVDSGRFGSAGEEIEVGVRLLDEHDRRLHHLRTLLVAAEEETARGQVVEWTPEPRRQIRREAEEMARRGVPPEGEAWRSTHG